MDVLLPVVLPIGCGIGVHKKARTACLLRTGASGDGLKEGRASRTMTGPLQELAAWLARAGCRPVAVESTGVYWGPVFNILEKAGIEAVLVNARHVRNVPGRKTDVEDAEWPATLLRVGLLRSSFVPPQEIREPRDRTRYRTRVVRQRADACNRTQKRLENGTIKRAASPATCRGPAAGTCSRHRARGWTTPGRWPTWPGGSCATSPPSWRRRCAGR